MANPYYNNTTNIIFDGDSAEASDVENKLNDVVDGLNIVESDINSRLSLTGGTVTGQIKGITPVADEDLANKQYVDNYAAPGIVPMILSEDTTEGQVVVMDVNGLAKPVTYTEAGVTPDAFHGYLFREATYSAYSPSLDRYVTVSYDSGASTFLYNLGREVGGTISFEKSSGINIPNLTNKYTSAVSGWKALWMEDEKQLVLIYIANPVSIWYTIGTVTDYDISWTVPQDTGISSVGFQLDALSGIDFVEDEREPGRLLLIHTLEPTGASTKPVVAVAIDAKGGGFVVLDELPLSLSAASYPTIVIVYDPRSERFLVGHTSSSIGYFAVVAFDGYTISAGSTKSLPPPDSSTVQLGRLPFAYDPNSQRLLGLFNDSSIRSFRIDGSTIIEEFIEPISLLLGLGYYGAELRHNPQNNTMQLVAGDYPNDDLFMIEFNSTGTGFNVIHETLIFAGSQNLTAPMAAYDSLNNRLLFTYGQGAAGYYRGADVSTITTDVSRFIGIANETGVATDSIGVTTYGGSNRKVTGLVKGGKYYADLTGTITATPNTAQDFSTIGRALEVDSLSIEGERDFNIFATNEDLALKLDVAGGTLDGNVVSPTPLAGSHIANKEYVDSFLGGTDIQLTAAAGSNILAGDAVMLRDDSKIEGPVSTITPFTLGANSPLDSSYSREFDILYVESLNKYVSIFRSQTGDTIYIRLGTTAVGGLSILWSGKFIISTTTYTDRVFSTRRFALTWEPIAERLVVAYVNSSYDQFIVSVNINGGTPSLGIPLSFGTLGDVDYHGVTLSFDVPSSELLCLYCEGTTTVKAKTFTLSVDTLSLVTTTTLGGGQTRNPSSQMIYDPVNNIHLASINGYIVPIVYSGGSVVGGVGVGSYSAHSTLCYNESLSHLYLVNGSIMYVYKVNSSSIILQYQLTIAPSTMSEVAVVFDKDEGYLYTFIKRDVDLDYQMLVHRDTGTELVEVSAMQEVYIDTVVDIGEVAGAYDSTTKNIVFCFYYGLYDRRYMNLDTIKGSTNIEAAIGVAAADIAENTTGAVTTIGAVNESVSGLTANTVQYVDANGVITDTPDLTLPNKRIGRALSANKLLITEG